MHMYMVGNKCNQNQIPCMCKHTRPVKLDSNSDTPDILFPVVSKTFRQEFRFLYQMLFFFGWAINTKHITVEVQDYPVLFKNVNVIISDNHPFSTVTQLPWQRFHFCMLLLVAYHYKAQDGSIFSANLQMQHDAVTMPKYELLPAAIAPLWGVEQHLFSRPPICSLFPFKASSTK